MAEEKITETNNENKEVSQEEENKNPFTGFLKKHKKQIFALLFFIAICIGLSLITFSRYIFGDETGDYILGPGVENGFVAVWNFIKTKKDALIGTLVIVFTSFVIYYVLYLVIKLISGSTPRRKTIGSILSSLLKYLMVIASIISILAIWGVNVAGIFASVGIVGLIIGIGCKSIVNDIVSGIFIVVDNYYQVGDRVTIDGFTGDVVSIGLRTTKIKAFADTKSICNSHISTVINTSREHNSIKIHIDISFNEDLRRVEAIIAKNLPEVNKKIPTLLEPIQYRGVTALDDCGVELEFMAFANFGDKFAAQRLLLREIYLMLADNGVIIPFQQIVVNQPDPINLPRANKEELEISKNLVYPEKKQEKVTKKSLFKKK